MLPDGPSGGDSHRNRQRGFALCLEAYEQLTKEGVRARVVSMPSWELFDDQDRSYRESVLPPAVKARVSVEEASDFGWSKYTGSEGHNICIESFWSLGAAEATAEEVRFHRGKHCGRGEKPDCSGIKLAE